MAEHPPWHDLWMFGGEDTGLQPPYVTTDYNGRGTSRLTLDGETGVHADARTAEIVAASLCFAQAVKWLGKRGYSLAWSKENNGWCVCDDQREPEIAFPKPRWADNFHAEPEWAVFNACRAILGVD